MKGAGIGLAGTVGGNLLDESSLLGGPEAPANDITSKMLKWGGTGAAIGSILPGKGTVVGGLIGGGIGLGHGLLEQAGVLGTESGAERSSSLMAEADQIAQSLGVPPHVIEDMRRQAQAQIAFAGDNPGALDQIAEQYRAGIAEVAQAFAADPTNDGWRSPDDLARDERLLESSANRNDAGLMRQAAMMDAISPYLDNMLAQSEAGAQSMESAAGALGHSAPIFRQAAQQTRTSAARDAFHLAKLSQIQPYLSALENQASYLKQAAHQNVSQAMGAIGSGAWDEFLMMQQMGGMQPAAAGDPLESIIDQYEAALG